MEGGEIEIERSIERGRYRETDSDREMDREGWRE